ncbi:macro domain containing protein [Bodo saltans virus]|uniref:Macro domain containing protein n=1 Tax=Bodo saltans virus TaxID=2024608 RepID=A0A2H4UV03_9VIRU|nr:macro domain containing protein [Bodo saltans virus]ATZ80686.1 macro domain containing protein [Bodo saltans virus]
MNEKNIKAYESVLANKIKGVKFVCGFLDDVMKNHSGINAIVSPANSYGIMNGGIDRDIEKMLHIEEDVQKRIQKVGVPDAFYQHARRYLPVGKCEVVFKNGIYLFVAPTMKTPCFLHSDTKNICCAFYAILMKYRELANLGIKIKIICPCLGTGVGNMDPSVSAKHVLNAYEYFMQTQLQ